MQVNSIRDLNMDDVLTVTKHNNDFIAHLKYEKREPLIKNIDLVVSFDKEYRVRTKWVIHYWVLQCKIGYTFNDVGLLTLALTHRSFLGAIIRRLEFLGDAIFELCRWRGAVSPFSAGQRRPAHACVHV